MQRIQGKWTKTVSPDGQFQERIDHLAWPKNAPLNAILRSYQHMLTPAPVPYPPMGNLLRPAGSRYGRPVTVPDGPGASPKHQHGYRAKLYSSLKAAAVREVDSEAEHEEVQERAHEHSGERFKRPAPRTQRFVASRAVTAPAKVARPAGATAAHTPAPAPPTSSVPVLPAVHTREAGPKVVTATGSRSGSRPMSAAGSARSAVLASSHASSAALSAGSGEAAEYSVAAAEEPLHEWVLAHRTSIAHCFGSHCFQCFKTKLLWQLAYSVCCIAAARICRPPVIHGFGM